MLSRDRIHAICARYSGSGWFLDRPMGGRVENVLTGWTRPPAAAGQIVALLDTTVFGSARAGVAVCDDGVRWEPARDQGECLWEDFGAITLRLRGDAYVQLGACAIDPTVGMKRESLLACLLELRQAAVDAGAPRRPAYVPRGHRFPAPGEPPPDLDVLRALLADPPVLEVPPKLAEKKVRNARESMKVPADETVLALFDDTVFRSARAGMAVGTRGIYWNNVYNVGGGDARPHRGWDELARVRVARCDKTVALDEEGWIYVTADDLSTLRMYEDALLRLQWWARAQLPPAARRAAIEAAFEAAPDEDEQMHDEARWFLAMNGRQFGPYPRSMVGEMIAAGQVSADACHAWAEGMAGWLPLMQVPELAALAAPPPPPIPPRPPAAPPAELERVDVNTAEVDDLLVLPGMTLALAALLVHERQVRGGFRDVDQVGQALRLQPHQVERLRERVTFGRIAASAARVVDF